MCNKLLRIFVISDDSDLEKAVRTVAPLEGFSHVVNGASKTDWPVERIAVSDVVVFDIAVEGLLKKIRDYRHLRQGAEAYAVYCDRTGSLADPEILSAVDDVWAAPFCETRVCFAFGRVQRLIETSRKMLLSEQAVINAETSPVIICAADGTIALINKAGEQMFEQKSAELIGKKYLDWKKSKLNLMAQSIGEKPKQNFGYLSGTKVFEFELSEKAIDCTVDKRYSWYCFFKNITEYKDRFRMLNKFKEVLEQDVAVKARTIGDIQQKIYLAFANIIDLRDKQTGTQLRYTSYIIKALMREMAKEGRFPELRDKEYCEAILKASLVHDIGMFVLPDNIIFKNGAYSEEDRRIMQQHTVFGKKMLDRTLAKLENFKGYKVASDMALYHHERFDGSGYPKGLVGKDIPLPARIMAVVDAFAALISPRSYRMTYTVQQAYSLMKSNAGVQFDLDIVAAFIMARPEIEKIVNEMIYKIEKG